LSLLQGSRSKRFFRTGGSLLSNVPVIGRHSAFAAPRTQELAGGFVLQSPVDANRDLGGFNQFYRKSLLPTANSTWGTAMSLIVL